MKYKAENPLVPGSEVTLDTSLGNARVTYERCRVSRAVARIKGKPMYPPGDVTIRDMLSCTDNELLSQPNFGVVSLEVVKKFRRAFESNGQEGALDARVDAVEREVERIKEALRACSLFLNFTPPPR